MARRKTDAEFRKEVKALVGDEYEVLDPYVNSKCKIRFRHIKCRSVFEMQPNHFIEGSRCPNCKNRKTDARFREQAYALTGNDYLIMSKYEGSKTKVWFKHLKCGFSFRMRPDQFLRGSRCPKCMRIQAAHKHKELNKKKRIQNTAKKAKPKKVEKRMSPSAFKARMKQMLGKDYIPVSNYVNKRTKVIVLHVKCGCVYRVSPSSISEGHGCSSCAHKHVGQVNRMGQKEFQAKIRQMGGGNYIPLQEYKGSKKKILMLHRICGHQYYVAPHAFFSGGRCPFCRASKGEKAVAKYLEDNKIKFDRQFIISNCKDTLPLPFDFAIFNKDKSINCLIEYQGWQHFVNPFKWQKKKGIFSIQSVLNTQKHDAIKLQYCKDHGIKLIRINHPQTSSKSNSIEFIRRLVNRTLNKELHVV